MIEPDLISVVVPVLNRARYIGPTIESILGQDYGKIECIVVDGGSTDGTLDIVRGYGERVELVLSEGDRGAFDAINLGWQRSRGGILAWLNADDLWAPGAAGIAASYLHSHPEVDVVYGHCRGVDAAGDQIWFGPAREWSLKQSILDCDHIINQAAAFMRRTSVEKVGWLYPAWCHDHDLWLQLALAGGVFEAVPHTLASCRIWEGNAHHEPGLTIAAKLGVVRRFFATPGLPADLRQIERRSWSNAFVRCLDYLRPWRGGDWPTGVQLVVRAIVADPGNAPHVIVESLRRAGWAGKRILLDARKRVVR